MDQFIPAAGGGFALLMLVVGLVVGAGGYRWLLASKHAALLKELEAKAAALEDKIRGR